MSKILEYVGIARELVKVLEDATHLKWYEQAPYFRQIGMALRGIQDQEEKRVINEQERSL
jgi:hypothetical protein